MHTPDGGAADGKSHVVDVGGAAGGSQQLKNDRDIDSTPIPLSSLVSASSQGCCTTTEHETAKGDTDEGLRQPPPLTTADTLPSSTSGSPLALCVQTWHRELTAVHLRTCTQQGACDGVRSLQEILKQDPLFPPSRPAARRKGPLLQTASTTQQIKAHPLVTEVGVDSQAAVSLAHGSCMQQPAGSHALAAEVSMDRLAAAATDSTQQCAPATAVHMSQQPGATKCAQATETELLLHGIWFGFYVLEPHAAVDSVPPMEVDNYARDPVDVEALNAKIAAELEQGIIEELQHKPAHLIPLFTKREADKIRPLKDYSAPHGASVNTYADANTFSMMSLEDAYALMKPRAWMAKVDIHDAFRTVGVHPKHRGLLNFKMKDPQTGQWRYYRETRFPMGLKCSPEIFCRLTHAVRSMMAARGMRAVVVYVDDFFITADTQEECQLALDMLLQLLKSLGFTISEKKTVLPTRKLTFLGLILETDYDGQGGMRVTVTPEKMQRARETAAHLASQDHITVLELQRALGFFNHIAKAIFAARVYLRRMIAVLQANASQKLFAVTADMRLDLLWWEHQADRHNGTAILLQKPVMARGFFATDASDWGMGGILGVKTFSVQWSKLDGCVRELLPRRLWKYVKPKYRPSPDNPATWWIDYREQFAMFFAMLLWHDDLTDRQAALHCDNIVAQYTLNKGSATALPMHALIRRMYMYMAESNIRVQVLRITSEANVIADALSRGAVEALRLALEAYVPLDSEHAWQPRVFRDPPLMEQAALRHMPSPPAGANIAFENDVLLMVAQCPTLTSDDYFSLGAYHD